MLLLILFIASFGLCDLINKLSFFFSPHPDDWTAFMQPYVWDSVHNTSKTIFIHITAGEDNNNPYVGNDGKYADFYIRESGSSGKTSFFLLLLALRFFFSYRLLKR